MKPSMLSPLWGWLTIKGLVSKPEIRVEAKRCQAAED